MLAWVRGSVGCVQACISVHVLHVQPTVSGLKGVEEEEEDEEWEEEASGKSLNKKLKIAQCLQALSEA